MNISLLKWFAYVSMIADHIGYIFFPQVYQLRILGRFAFPIFAATFIRGFKQSKQKSKISEKLFYWGVATQIALAILEKNDFNILFTFLLFSLQVQLASHRIKLLRFIPLMIAPLYHWCDYGFYGFALLCFFWWYPQKKIDQLLYYACLTISSGLIYQFNSYEILSWPAVDGCMNSNVWGSRYNFYLMYAFQWWAIAVTWAIMNKPIIYANLLG